MDGWKEVTVGGIAAVSAVSSASRFISARVQRPGGGRICRCLEPLKGSVHVQIESQTPYGTTFATRLTSCNRLCCHIWILASRAHGTVVGTCRRPDPLEGSVHAQIEHQTPFGATFAMRLASLACFRRDLVGSR